jgi:hypothetical protein
MKSSWIMGVIMSYLLILGIELLVTEGNLFSNPITANAGVLAQPDIITSGSIFSQVGAILSQLGTWISTFIQVLFLYNASVFSGYMIWVYVLICLPITIATIYGVVQLIRGTG